MGRSINIRGGFFAKRPSDAAGIVGSGPATQLATVQHYHLIDNRLCYAGEQKISYGTQNRLLPGNIKRRFLEVRCVGEDNKIIDFPKKGTLVVASVPYTSGWWATARLRSKRRNNHEACMTDLASGKVDLDTMAYYPWESRHKIYALCNEWGREYATSRNTMIQSYHFGMSEDVERDLARLIDDPIMQEFWEYTMSGQLKTGFKAIKRQIGEIEGEHLDTCQKLFYLSVKQALAGPSELVPKLEHQPVAIKAGYIYRGHIDNLIRKLNEQFVKADVPYDSDEFNKELTKIIRRNSRFLKESHI